MALRVRLGLSCLLVATLPLLAAGCGDDDDTPAVDSGPGGDGGGDGGTDGGTGFAVLNPFLPAVPAPTGGARVTFAEEITTANRTTTLIPGLAVEDVIGYAGDGVTNNKYVLISGAFNVAGVAGNGKSVLKLTPDSVAPGGHQVALAAWLASGDNFPVNLDGLEIIR